ncbi:MAG: Lrp/AsnC ligand binding domain-containing protein [Nitrososphaerota archaeon]|nr:Lrp/AsnC ligand binding domain-containing protein [Candidatus Bathyarchaeota archaeon]MDW8048774.1 Lrp/AsnC ligand binding domain-containing protein [Nitrososphaerota archaeon]
MVSACVLVRTSHGRFDEVVQKIRQIKGVEKVFPVLGRYDVVVDLGDLEPMELQSTVLRIGRLAGVVFTETLVEIKI